MQRVIYCLTALAASAAAFAADSGRPSQWTGERLACKECHTRLTNEFRSTGHGKAMEFGVGGRELDCGTCHAGDRARHMLTGKPDFITNQGKEKPEAVTAACMSCHASDKHVMFWRASPHESAGVGCLGCHAIHKPSEQGKLTAEKSEAETCFRCHANVRKAMLQRSRHLFRDERGAFQLQCSACHNAHGAQTEKLISANSINDKCYSCHQEKRGPFLWEHSPVRENCMNCHSPHGSNNEALLTLRRPQLCQSCHIQQRHQTNPGRPSALFNVNRSCQNCHAKVHGSNHPSGVTLIW
jgi:DmsE family decaheme c-type cytochrome